MIRLTSLSSTSHIFTTGSLANLSMVQLKSDGVNTQVSATEKATVDDVTEKLTSCLMTNTKDEYEECKSTAKVDGVDTADGQWSVF